MVPLSYFLSSLSRGKQTWMMSFSTPWDHSLSLFFLLASGKTSTWRPWCEWVWSFPSKRNGEGLFGDKRPINVSFLLWFKFYVSPQLVHVHSTLLCSTLSNRGNRFSATPSLFFSCFLPSCLFPSTLCIQAPSPISHCHPHPFPFCHPAFLFIQRGGEAFRYWQKAHFCDGSKSSLWEVHLLIVSASTLKNIIQCSGIVFLGLRRFSYFSVSVLRIRFTSIFRCRGLNENFA